MFCRQNAACIRQALVPRDTIRTHRNTRFLSRFPPFSSADVEEKVELTSDPRLPFVGDRMSGPVHTSSRYRLFRSDRRDPYLDLSNFDFYLNFHVPPMKILFHNNFSVGTVFSSPMSNNLFNFHQCHLGIEKVRFLLRIILRR